jgi:hypothetical protein
MDGIRNVEIFFETKCLIPFKIFVTITPSSLTFVLVWRNSENTFAGFFQSLLRCRRIARPFWYISYWTRLRMPKSGRRYVTSMFAGSSNLTSRRSFKILGLKIIQYLIKVHNCCRWNIVGVCRILWCTRSWRQLTSLGQFFAKHMFCRNVILIYVEPGTIGLKVYPMT